MAVNRPGSWLIAYDIRNKRRLVRVHRYMKKHAIPLQYSLFLTHASAGRIGTLAKGIEALMDVRQDDVRIYRIPEPVDAVVYGRSILPLGALIPERNAGWTGDT